MSSELESFLILAKTAKGAACGSLIAQVTEAPNIFVFTELLDMPNVKELALSPAHQPALDLLKLFAYGTYPDYANGAGRFPELSANQQTKLRILTIVSLAAQSKTIPYSELQKSLRLQSVRDIEDIVIDAIYRGVIRGSLNQKQQHLYVDFAIGRDIQSDAQVSDMIETLEGWCHRCESLLSHITANMMNATSVREQDLAAQKLFEQELESAKRTTTSRASSTGYAFGGKEGSIAGMHEDDSAMMDEGRRGKRSVGKRRDFHAK